VLKNRQVHAVAKAIENVLGLYRRRGFRVTECKADMEFKPVQNSFHSITFNVCAQDEHVPKIECYIQTVKDCSQSGYNSLPFERIPRLVVVRLVGNSIFWLNAFPHEDSISGTLSPRYLITGRHLDYRKHVRLEFGAYVQTHEQCTNGMERRTCGAICLGPTGNEQGGHYFMSLATGL
jgi:acetolactate synthase regulatory subunit